MHHQVVSNIANIIAGIQMEILKGSTKDAFSLVVSAEEGLFQ